MCGLCGVAGHIYAQDEVAFRKMLIYNSTRGTDSTGAGSIKRHTKENAVLAKELGNPFELFSIKRKNEHDFSDVLSGQNKVLIGHTRSATKGSVFRRNAHPFLFDNVLGAHNGTLEWEAINKLKYNKKYDTDSEALICEIEISSIQETVPKLKGAWALSWFDARNNTINLLRNKERTLFYTFDEENKKLYWSSEWEHLSSGTNHIKRKQNSLHLLPEDMLYSWVIPEVNQEFSEPVREKLEGAKPVPLVGYSYHGNTSGNHPAYPLWDSKRNIYRKYDTVRKCLVESKDMSGPWIESFDEGEELSTMKLIKKSAATSITSGREVLVEKIFKDEIGEPKAALIYKSADLKAYYFNDKKIYTIFKFKGFKDGWEEINAKICPAEIPFRSVDVNARHEFHTSGHGVRRKTQYKGFKGKLLSEGDFNELMVSGCLVCSRNPTWGNLVSFINDKDFLCEHCSRDQEQVMAWRMADKV